MGVLRGKRNRDQDRYWHERRKAIQAGMTATALEVSVICSQCGMIAIQEESHLGWCLPCVSKWVETSDPWLIYQAQRQLPAAVVPVSRMKQIERLQTHIAEPVPDDAFLPLTQFMGWRGIGFQKSMWNYLHALYMFEIDTTARATRAFGVNTLHLCGRHAGVQRSSIQGFLSRVHSAGDAFALFRQDQRFRDYVRGFASDNRIQLFDYQRTSIDVFDRAKTLRFIAKYGKTHFDKHSPAFWPFESERHGKLRDQGQMEELPDFVMEIGKLLPTASMPETLREDLCQDLVVAVLAGEVTLDELRIENRMKHYVRQAFRHHPLKYGRFSLDHPSPQFEHKGEDYMLSRDWVTDDDVSPDRADRGWLEAQCIDHAETEYGWHEGHDRPRGIASLGDIARHNHGGHAIQGPDVVRTPDEIDDDIREVFELDQHPQWRRRLSD